MKKYLIFLLVLLLAIGAVSATGGFDDMLNELDSFAELDVNFTDSDTNVTVGDYNFTIPKGFGAIDMLSVNVSEKNDSQNVKFFTNSNHDMITISLSSSDNVTDTIYNFVSDDGSCENATIAGHDGIKWNNDTYSIFAFQDNNSVIVLQAPDDTYLEKIIN